MTIACYFGNELNSTMKKIPLSGYLVAILNLADLSFMLGYSVLSSATLGKPTFEELFLTPTSPHTLQNVFRL